MVGEVRLQDGGKGQTAGGWERSDCRMVGEVRLKDVRRGQTGDDRRGQTVG